MTVSTMFIFCLIVVGQVVSCLHWSIILFVVTWCGVSILMKGLVVCLDIRMVRFGVG